MEDKPAPSSSLSIDIVFKGIVIEDCSVLVIVAGVLTIFVESSFMEVKVVRWTRGRFCHLSQRFL